MSVFLMDSIVFPTRTSFVMAFGRSGEKNKDEISLLRFTAILSQRIFPVFGRTVDISGRLFTFRFCESFPLTPSAKEERLRLIMLFKRSTRCHLVYFILSDTRFPFKIKAMKSLVLLSFPVKYILIALSMFILFSPKTLRNSESFQRSSARSVALSILRKRAFSLDFGNNSAIFSDTNSFGSFVVKSERS